MDKIAIDQCPNQQQQNHHAQNRQDIGTFLITAGHMSGHGGGITLLFWHGQIETN
jgi:hypothetical protein